ncbi:MAG: 3-deoxy-8-phosphooctulonate synthase [Candidatus Gastranaerophilales bacterium]|nr:3-deoxy-8-phosphooctulonate synthase [Candidatus Gastranaerophilales bacterium]
MNIINKVKLNDFIEFGSDNLVIMAGPCVIEENVSVVIKTAEKLKEITTKLGLPYIFKASYDKANRTSIDSYRGVGIEKGLNLLLKIKKDLELPIVTDIHQPHEADIVAEVADIIQIPAFLCRQTDMLIAAAKTGKIVNIKKGQFLSPAQIENSAQKVIKSGNKRVVITERGTCFGYNNLVSDMRSIPIMQELGYPIIFDATHSIQLPGGAGTCSSGERKFALTLAKSAVAAGCNGLFFEIHPDPDKAPCDGANMIPLDQAYDVFSICKEIFNVVN